MATYYVSTSGSDSNNGSSGSPWATFDKADAACAAGDTIRIAPGTYSQILKITKANTTWRVDGNGSSPVILAGGYNYATAGQSGSNDIKECEQVSASLINNRNGAMLSIQANGVTVDGIAKYGIILRDSGGRFVNIGADGVTVRYVRGDFAYYNCVHLDGTSNTVVEHCAFTRSSIITFSSARKNPESGNPRRVTPSAIIPLKTNNTILRDVYVAYCTGEGIDAAAGSNNTLIVGCEVVQAAHVHFYANGGRNAVFAGNIAWSDPHVPYKALSPYATQNSFISNGMAAGDEYARSIKHGYYARNPKFYNNLVVATKDGFQIRGNTGATANYSSSMTDIYIGYNTFVGYRPAGMHDDDGSQSAVIIKNTWEAGHGTKHGGIIENNIFLFMDGHQPSKGADIGQYQGSHNLVFRNNVWYKQPPVAMRGPGDFYGSPRLVDQKYELPRTGYTDAVRKSTALCPIVSLRDDVTWAELLPSSPAVGRAATGSAGGFTPPDVDTDFYDAVRGSDPDCGFIEFDGTPPDPDEDTLDASFSQSATGGTVPLTVNFTDTSDSSGTVNWWYWQFGDGTTSTSENPTKAYNSPGVYTPRLTVRDTNGLEDTAIGATITVQTPTDPGGGGGSGSATGIDVQRIALPTSTGTTDVTFNLGGRVPALVLAIAGAGTTAGTLVDDAMLSLGAWSGNTQACRVNYSRDNQATAHSKSLALNNALVAWVNSSGLAGRASVDSVGIDRVTLYTDDAFPAAGLCTLIAFAGSTLEAAVTVASPSGGAVSLPASNLALLFANFAGDTVGAGGQMSLGAATPAAQTYAAGWDIDAYPAAEVAYTNGTDAVAHYRSPSASRGYITAGNLTTGHFPASGATINQSVVAATWQTGDGVYAGQIVAPGDTGSASYDVGFEPGFVLLFGGLAGALGGAIANNNIGNNAFWVAAVRGDGTTFYTAIGAKDGADPTDTFSHAENSIKVYDGDKTVELAGTVTLDEDGFDINWTTARAVGIGVLAIEVGEEVPINAVPGFTAAPTTIETGRSVTFTNLTSANGQTILGYEWQFGDGATSTATNPTHVYDEAGVYNVSLTVTTGLGPVTLIKPGLITVEYVPVVLDVIGPYDPVTITNTTITKRHHEAAGPDEDNDDVLAWMEYGLDLDGVEIQLDPEDRAVPTGYVWIYAESDDDGGFILRAKNGAGNTYTGPQFARGN